MDNDITGVARTENVLTEKILFARLFDRFLENTISLEELSTDVDKRKFLT